MGKIYENPDTICPLLSMDGIKRNCAGEECEWCNLETGDCIIYDAAKKFAMFAGKYGEGEE